MTTDNKYMLDSSVWIGYFKANPEFSLVENLIVLGKVVINDVILSELLPSMIAREEYDRAAAICALDLIPMNINWKEIREYQTLLMRNGHFKIGIPDLLIAQNCIQNDIQVISCDKHFQTLAKYLPLKLK